MFPILQIGPFAVQAPGLFLLLGIWLGLNLAERLAPRFGSQASTIYNLTFIALVAGLVGARLSYVFQYLDAFTASPLSLISLNPGLLDPIGGTVIGILAAAIYANRKKLPPTPTLNALTPLLAVFTIALGFSHLASGKVFGMETDLFWGIDLWGAKRHPTQVYEIILASLTLRLIWPHRDSTERVIIGTFWRFLAFNAGARLLIEGFRADSILLPNGIRTAQIAAWFVLAVGLFMLSRNQESFLTYKHDK